MSPDSGLISHREWQAAGVSASREQWATSVVLGDGETGYVRAMTTDDAPQLLAFHERQPRENLYRRFFSPKPTLSTKELAHFTDIDFVDRVALVLEIRGEFSAWASYERWPGRDDADVAFMVDDGHQGKGIATLLLEHLAAIARSNGIHRFTADVLADNRSMLRVFARAGWPIQRHFDSGVMELEFALLDTELFVDSVEDREHRADSRAVARLLLPRSIAVIGASDQAGSIGHELWHSVSSGTLPAFAVNARHDTIGGQRAYASVLDIEDDVWLAIIATPAATLPDVIDQCIRKRVRGAVVVTAIDGTDVDIAALVSHARRNGMRLIGPASMGIATGHASPGWRRSRPPWHRSTYRPVASPSRCSRARWARRCCSWRSRCRSACRGSCRWATSAICRATTCCSSGRTTRTPASSPCTPSRSATRASSPGSPGAWVARARSSRSAPALRPWARRATRCTSRRG